MRKPPAIVVVLVLMACGGSGAEAVAAVAYPEGPRRAEAARNALAEIRQRQEAYRAEFGRYTDLTGDATWLPATAPGPLGVVPWTPTPATRLLGYEPDRPNVAWQIQVFDGFPGTVAPAPGRARGTGASVDDFWFVARARGHFRSADRIDVLESRWDQREPVMLE